MAEKVNLQHKIQAYRQSNPKLKKLSDNQVLSIMVKNGVITLTAEQKQSILASSKQKDNNTGLQVEKTTKAKPKKTIYLQSGRKVVYSRLADGRTVMRYFGADGTPIKPDYFKKVEGQISIAANGSSYTVTKNGKKRVLKAKNPTQGAVDQNLARLNNEEKRLNKTKKEQGWIGKGWDWVKNKTGIGDGSDKAQQQINAERKLLNQVKTGKISKKDFKNATGVEYTKENLEKFKHGELSQASTKINGYKEGQDMAADVVGDMVSGIAAVTIYTAAVAAAPFTGGASIAVGVAAATASGALIKAGVKALDTVGTDKKYTMKDFGHDLATGAFSGALAPITGGFGGAVGKTVATKLGIQAVKQVGKEVTEEVVETGVKQGLKTALTNPAGYEYVGGTLLKRGTAMAAEMATDGALGGAIDGGFRAGLDNNWDTEAMLDGAVEGGIGGAIMSPIIGGGFKTMGKGAQKVFGKDNVHINENNKVIRDDVVNDFLAGKVDDKYVAAVLRDVDDLEQAFKVAETHTKDKVKLAEAKNKILEKVNKNIADHGSIVLQNEIPASYFSVDPKSGVKYAIASQDDIFLVHAVPQGKEIKSLSYLIDVTNKKSDDAYLSLSLVNKNSSLFNDDALGFGIPVEYGIIPKNRSINVTSAGQGQASCIEKNFTVFVHHQSLENSPEHYVLLKNSLLKNLRNKGYDLTDKDYIALFNELKHKEYFNEITNDIKIGNKVLKADELRDALELSSVELSSTSMYGQGSNNEVTSIIDGIKAIFARVDNIDDVKPEIKQLAKDNGLDIVLLGKPTRLDVESNPKFQSELKSIEQAFKDGKINMIQRMQQRRKLRTKYEATEKEKLRARTTAEQKKLIQNQEKIDNILSKFNPNREQKIVKELLNDKTLSYVEKFVSDDTPPSQLMRFLDVINRRDYDASALEQIIKKKQVIDDKLINTLEFKNLDRFKNITLEDFSSLSIEERKEFINAFISIKYNEGHLKDLPDIAIFDEIKNLEKPQMPSPTATPTEKKEYLANKKAFSNKIADFYSNTLNKMLETIPRTKNDIPVSANRLNPNVNLVTKPALTTDVSKITTEKVNINGHNVKVGQVKEDGTYFLHNLEDESIPKLEAYLLTDPDAILCTGFVGGKGMIKSSGNRPGIIVSPKNSMEDLLITAKEDVSSGFGAIKNYFNIQNLFLNKRNEYNNYIPKLLKEKLNLSAEEYNVRLEKLKNLTHIDDIETVDKEFYNAIKTVISENPIFESIMRPNIEAIYLPKGMKISENVASFAERYDVPILFKDATDVPKTAPSANLYASKVQITETPIQIQQRLINELETAKNREDFSRITQEIKNLPKTEEYRAIRQRLGGEYLQRYNEWKADLPESTRSIVNMATDENGGVNSLKINTNKQELINTLKELGLSDKEIQSLDLESSEYHYINKENIEKIKTMCGTDDLDSVLGLLTSNNIELLFDKIQFVHSKNIPIDIESLSLLSTEEINNITNVKMLANIKITRALGGKFNFNTCVEITDTNKITDDFINKFKQIYEKLKQKNINVELSENPIQLFNELKSIEQDLQSLEKLGVEFNTSRTTNLGRIKSQLSKIKGKNYNDGILDDLCNNFETEKINKLVQLKDDTGENRFTITDIHTLLKISKNFSLIEELANFKDRNGKSKYTTEQIKTLLNCKNRDIMDVRDELLYNENDIDSSSIVEIIDYLAKEEHSNVIKNIIKRKIYSSNHNKEIKDILALIKYSQDKQTANFVNENVHKLQNIDDIQAVMNYIQQDFNLLPKLKHILEVLQQSNLKADTINKYILLKDTTELDKILADKNILARFSKDSIIDVYNSPLGKDVINNTSMNESEYSLLISQLGNNWGASEKATFCYMLLNNDIKHIDFKTLIQMITRFSDRNGTFIQIMQKHPEVLTKILNKFKNITEIKTENLLETNNVSILVKTNEAESHIFINQDGKLNITNTQKGNTLQRQDGSSLYDTTHFQIEKDNEGHILSRTLRKQSKRNNNVTIALRENYNKQGKVESVDELENYHRTSNGGSIIHRNIKSTSGNTSQQIIEENSQHHNCRYKSENFNFERKFDKFNNQNNTTKSAINGQQYQATFSKNDIVIARKTKAGILEKIVINKSEIAPELYDFYKLIPPDCLFMLKKYNCNVIYEPDLSRAYYSEMGNTIHIGKDSMEDMSTFLHEWGHFMDHNVLQNMSMTDKTFLTIYIKELEKFRVNNNYGTLKEVGYYTTWDYHGYKSAWYGNLSEIIAEGNAIISGCKRSSSRNDRILQENFPETIAYVMKKLYGEDH